MNEEIEQAAPEVETPEDPMENLMAVLGDLQERYNIQQEDMDAVVDAINVAFGGYEDEGAEMPEEGDEVPSGLTA